MISINIENFKRISAVEIYPPDGVLEIRGANAQGKSSVLDAIEAALAGAAASPDRPVRDGERKASVRCDLGEYTVTRRWTADGGSNLTVRAKNGTEIKSPQTVLNSLFGLGSFDPFAFVGAEPAKQAKMLRDLLKIDTSDLDKARQEVFDERGLVNAAVRAAEASLSARAPAYPDVPAKEILISDLLKQANAARAVVTANQDRRQETVNLNGFKTNNNNKIVLQQEKIEEAQRQIEALQAVIAEAKRSITEIEQENADLDEMIRQAEGEAAKLVDPDVAGIEQAIEAAEETNRRVRHNADLQADQQSLAENRGHAQSLTEQLARIEADKLARFAAAPYPVPGLGFDGERVLYNGLPISQASTAEQIRIGLGICSALNPTLRTILVRDGSALDTHAMTSLREWASDRQFQVLIERVDERGGDGAILIEDGQIAKG